MCTDEWLAGYVMKKIIEMIEMIEMIQDVVESRDGRKMVEMDWNMGTFEKSAEG